MFVLHKLQNLNFRPFTRLYFICRTSSLPNFVGTFVQTVPAHTLVAEPIAQLPLTTEVPEEKPDLNTLPPLPPPLYQDATKLLRVKQASLSKNSSLGLTYQFGIQFFMIFLSANNFMFLYFIINPIYTFNKSPEFQHYGN